MSRRPTKRLTWDFVLRSFDRLRMMRRLNVELLAKELVADPAAARRADIMGCYDWVYELACEMKKLGYDDDTAGRKRGNCAVCGKDTIRDSNAAIYCSRECRQRAYRERKAKAQGRNSPLPKRRPSQAVRRRREWLKQQVAEVKAELQLKQCLRAFGCNAKALSDVSSSADGETAVTQGAAP
jgi:hypothetical protein